MRTGKKNAARFKDERMERQIGRREIMDSSIDRKTTHTLACWSGSTTSGKIIHGLPSPVSPVLANMNPRLENRNANQTPQSVMSNTSLQEHAVRISSVAREILV